jgi:hypothetical protein
MIRKGKWGVGVYNGTLYIVRRTIYNTYIITSHLQLTLTYFISHVNLTTGYGMHLHLGR